MAMVVALVSFVQPALQSYTLLLSPVAAKTKEKAQRRITSCYDNGYHTSALYIPSFIFDITIPLSPPKTKGEGMSST